MTNRTKTTIFEAMIAAFAVPVIVISVAGFTVLLINITGEHEEAQAARDAAPYEIDCSTGPHIYAQTIEKGEKGLDVITMDGRKVFIPWTNVGSIEKR